MQKLTRIMLLSEPGKVLEYKLETQEFRGTDRSMLGTPMQHGEKWLQPPKCHAWLVLRGGAQASAYPVKANENSI